MKRHDRQFLPLLSTLAVALGAGSAEATSVQDLVRIKGHERNTIVGLGIVVGLDGTGDESRDSLVAARPYEQLLRNMGNPVDSIEELAEADSYAIVQVELEIPAVGTRSGDRHTVTVSTLFNATSLAGGQLVMSPLRLPLPGAMTRPPMAFANGSVVIEGDNPRRGIVRDGGQMIADVRTNPVTAAGTLTLVLKDEYAGFPIADALASVINDYESPDGLRPVAYVEDAKNVLIVLPPQHRPSPAGFIARLLELYIHPSLLQSGARIAINEREGIITVTGNVELGSVLITHKGLSIRTLSPEPVPTPDTPVLDERRWTEMGTTKKGAAQATHLTDLLSAFDQLNVSVDDQIAIIHLLKSTGRLHAEIVNQ